MNTNALDPDTPLSLEDAARLCCGGLVKAATLRAAAARGELTIERLGKKIITTPAYVKGWRESCRELAKGRGSRENPPLRGGLSETEESKLALASALEIARRLKESSKNTYRANTRRNGVNAR